MISPQGYQLGADPKSKNPFWDENGEDSSVNKIYATATVDDETGVPGVVTSKSVSGNDITFNFDFHNLKGERGEDSSVNKIYATATVDDKTGVPGVVTSKSVSGNDITFNFDFHNLKGERGETGPGVPIGGSAGQVLTKVDGTDYNTEWKDPTGGGGGGHVEWKADAQGGGIYPQSSHLDYVLQNGSTGNLSTTYTVPDDQTESTFDVTVMWGWDYSANTKIGESDNIVLVPGATPINSESFYSDNVLGLDAYSVSTNKEGLTATINVNYCTYTLNDFTFNFTINTSDGKSYNESEKMDYSNMNDYAMSSGFTFNVLSVVE